MANLQKMALRIFSPSLYAGSRQDWGGGGLDDGTHGVLREWDSVEDGAERKRKKTYAAACFFPSPLFRRRRMQVSLLFSIRRRLLLRLPSSLSPPPPFRSLEGAAAKKVWTEEALGGSRGERKERELATGFFPSSPFLFLQLPEKKKERERKMS